MLKASALFWVMALLLIIGYNLVLPLPISNDFPGLGMSCQLIEKQGIRYAINSNWGFAHTALCYALSEIMPNLQIAQRLLTGVFSMLSLLFIYKISFHQLGVLKDRKSLLAIGLLAGSYFYMDMALSPHMDIIPISLLLWVISRLDKTTGQQLFLSGVLLGMTYWFRFHFLLPALVFPFWAIIYFREAKARRVFWLFAGILPTIALPFLFTRFAFGMWSVSNQKALLGEMIYGENWDCDFQYALQHIKWSQLWADFELIEAVRRFASDFTYHTEMSLVLVMLLTYLFTERFPFRENRNEILRKIALVLIFLMTCILPLLFIRTATTRLMAMLILPAFPFMLALVRRKPDIYMAMILLLGLTFLWRNISQCMAMWTRQQKMREDIILLEKHAGKTAMRSYPESIYVSEEFFNPYNRFHLLNPALTHAWPCRYAPFREQFGVLRPADLHVPGTRPIFDYLIFTHRPNNTLFEYSEKELLQHYDLLEKSASGTMVWRNKNLSK
jgi:hypothetical protein